MHKPRMEWYSLRNGTNSNKHSTRVKALCQEKEVRLKGYILYDSPYWTFSK